MMYVDQNLVVVDLVHVVVQLVCRLGKHALRGDYPFNKPSSGGSIPMAMAGRPLPISWNRLLLIHTICKQFVLVAAFLYQENI